MLSRAGERFLGLQPIPKHKFTWDYDPFYPKGTLMTQIERIRGNLAQPKGHYHTSAQHDMKILLDAYDRAIAERDDAYDAMEEMRSIAVERDEDAGRE